MKRSAAKCQRFRLVRIGDKGPGSCCHGVSNRRFSNRSYRGELDGNAEMNEPQDDYRHLMEQKRFLGEIEQGIRQSNRQIIHQRIPSLSKETVLAFALALGRLRARYLEAAFQ